LKIFIIYCSYLFCPEVFYYSFSKHLEYLNIPKISIENYIENHYCRELEFLQEDIQYIDSVDKNIREKHMDYLQEQIDNYCLFVV
jgi:hypothetical protein